MKRWLCSLLIIGLAGCANSSQFGSWNRTGLPELHEPPLTEPAD